MRVFTRITLFILALGLSLIVPTGAALAAPDVTTRQETFQTFTNLCNGELLQLNGTFTAVVRDNGDGTTTGIGQTRLTGTTSSGTEYVYNATRQSVSAGGFELKGDAHNVLVSKGSGSNYEATFHFDFTVDPPVIDLDVNCVG